MIQWAPYAFVRLTLALAAGILTYLYYGTSLPPLTGLVIGLSILYAGLQLWAGRKASPALLDGLGLLALGVVYLVGLALTQQATESRAPNHLLRFGNRIEFYRAVVDDYTVIRPATYASTVRVSAVRVAGKWQAAVGSIRVSIPRDSGSTVPQYGDVWLVRGAPAPSKAPLNPGEFDYRRYLQYHQVYHQQFIHPDQYLKLGVDVPSQWTALGMRAARVLDGVFRQYVHAKREYALASALVLGIKDDVDQETRQAYANTGTTHIMAVSGLQVGLLFAAVTWLLSLLPGRRGPLFRFGTAGLGLAVIWSYALLTGLSASVLRAAVMFTFIIVGRASGRQSNIFNTLALAAFALLCYNPFLLVDVGFQLSFLAVLSIVYLQPRIVARLRVREFFLDQQRPWQPKAVQKFWKASSWFGDVVWQATALSLAAQVATLPLSLHYFHQFPLSFLASNLIAVPISSAAVYVGLALLVVKGLVAVVALALPAAGAWLNWLPQAIGFVFEWMIWFFNEYIFWVGQAMPGALLKEIHLSASQTWLLFASIMALLIFFEVRHLTWLGVVCALAGVLAGSKVWAARQLADDRKLVVYSIPRRSVLGFWQGPAGDIVMADSLPLSETERTYRIVPGSIQREARRVLYFQGWPQAPVPARRLGQSTLLVWHGLRVLLIDGRLAAARQPSRADIIILRRNARVWPEQLAAAFGTAAPVVFDSSCKAWYVARQDSILRAAGFRTYDVTMRGAFIVAPRR
ncbi:ComEC family competence protein [Hymenobacter lutimineralis]|uniref:ComEC family competence protein n=1 Tax=Hymenobacter lutimineralis TaxID=2606448 RepID=A0A5D6UXJ6_9BACT|nr:ComEC/Rec2 family competence protein [Hymenobacter lutimineralis]TYZ07618.1 ComEC family competence protein [Hymenobacter lutimineralis]